MFGDEGLGDHLLDRSGAIADTEQLSDTRVHIDEEQTDETEVSK